MMKIEQKEMVVVKYVQLKNFLNAKVLPVNALQNVETETYVPVKHVMMEIQTGKMDALTNVM